MLETDESRIEYLKEHLLYELKMLRYTHWKLREPLETVFDWNSYLEAFAVHARNWHDFLTEKFQPRADRIDARASHFIETWPAANRDKVKDTYNDLHAQVLHLGTNRGITPEEKFTTRHADAFWDWIRPEMERFADCLPPQLREHWKPEEAEPKLLRTKLFNRGSDKQPTATTSGRSMGS